MPKQFLKHCSHLLEKSSNFLLKSSSILNQESLNYWCQVQCSEEEPNLGQKVSCAEDERLLHLSNALYAGFPNELDSDTLIEPAIFAKKQEQPSGCRNEVHNS